MAVEKLPPHHCNGCTNRWDGLLTAHCTGCHRTFTRISVWEKHREGGHAKGRYCIDPASAGLVDAGRTYPCWALPGTYDREDSE